MIPKFILTLLAICAFSDYLSAQNQNLKADEIINNYIKAMGGKEQLESAQSMKLTGLYSFRGFEYPVTIIRMRPHYIRIEIIVDGKTQISGFDGEIAWEINEAISTEPKEVQDPRTKSFIDIHADFDGALVDYQDKGHQIALSGFQDVDGIKAFALKVTKKSGKIENWYIDASSFLLLKLSSINKYGDREINQTMFYLDYEPAKGLKVPHFIERLDAPHYVRQYEFSAVEINPEIDIKLFKIPEITIQDK